MHLTELNKQFQGSDPRSTQPYEDELCGGTEPRGVAILGDSVGAHFHLPEEWFDSQKLSAVSRIVRFW